MRAIMGAFLVMNVLCVLVGLYYWPQYSPALIVLNAGMAVIIGMCLTEPPIRRG